ncbi:hypothetical protein N7G274_005477 [Stereocaulon virgatum]|uniref:Secreted protein n=1 Tax=Stereocaulon virgatum TaxID=373712 RepID=A0ABR4AE87_9LECA
MHCLVILPVLALLHGVAFGQYCASTSSQPFQLNTLEGETNTGGNDGIAPSSIGFTLHDPNQPSYSTLCGMSLSISSSRSTRACTSDAGHNSSLWEYHSSADRYCFPLLHRPECVFPVSH